MTRKSARRNLFLALVMVAGCPSGTTKPEEEAPPKFSFCPTTTEEFSCQWELMPSQEDPPPGVSDMGGHAPLIIRGEWSPDGETIACSGVPLHPGSRYHFHAWGQVNYRASNPAFPLLYGPDGNGTASVSPPFIESHMALDGENGTASEFSLMFRAAKLGRWRALGTRYNHWLPNNQLNPEWYHYDDPAGLERQLCFAANDTLGFYGDNVGDYLVTIYEQRQVCKCRPIITGTGGNGQVEGGNGCGTQCSLAGKGVCALGHVECKGTPPVKTCVQTRPKGPDTNCDLMDDDCDGKADEDFESKACQLDPSPCQASFKVNSTTQCKNGKSSCVDPHDYCVCPLSGIINPGCGQCPGNTCHTNRDCAPNLQCRPTGTFAQNCSDITSTCACTPIPGCAVPKCYPPGAKGTLMDGCKPAQPICLSPGDTCVGRDPNCCFPLECVSGKCSPANQCVNDGGACILTFDCCKGACKQNVCK